MTAGCGTPQWMAPEVLQAEPYNEAADVYTRFRYRALGGGDQRCPYDDAPDLAGVALAMRVVRDGLRPSIPEGSDRGLVGLAKACWASDAAARPSAARRGAFGKGRRRARGGCSGLGEPVCSLLR